MRALDVFRAEQDAERADDARIESLTNDVMFALDAYAVERHQAKQRLRERLLRAVSEEEPAPIRRDHGQAVHYQDPRANGQWGPYNG